MLDTFINYLTYERRLSQHTIVAYQTDLTQLSTYLQNQFQLMEPHQATHKMLRDWVMELARKGLDNRSINRKIATLRAFYGFLCAKQLASKNEATHLKGLKIKRVLPVFLREQELIHLLDNHPFPDTFEGWRDKLVLELLYSTGIRLRELLELQDASINFYERTIRIIGKRNKERILPLPKHILSIVERYLAHRQTITSIPCRLFITAGNKPCYPMLIQRLVKQHVGSYTQADRHSPHVLRHTFATHLLNHGAELQAIKELLGHATLAATQVYTHNSMDKLKQVFLQAHPRA
jgi:integrase/recombinase XerC